MCCVEERRLVRYAEVLTLTGLTQKTFRRLLQAGWIPMPVQLSERSKGWWHHEVLAWMDGRPRASRSGLARSRLC